MFWASDVEFTFLVGYRANPIVAPERNARPLIKALYV